MSRHRPAIVLGAAALAATVVGVSAWPASAVAPTPRVVATIGGMLSTSFQIALSPDASTAYVANTSDRLAILDTATGSVTTSASLLSSGPRRDVAVAPDGSKVYASGTNALDVLNPDGTLDHTVGASGAQLGAIAAAPGNASVVGIADSGGPVLYRFNLTPSTHTPIAVPGATPLALTDVAIEPTSGHVFVTGSTAASQAVLYAFDDVFGSNPRTILLPGSSWVGTLAISPDGSTAAVMDQVSHLLYTVDLSSGTVAAPIATSVDGIRLAFSPDGATLYVAGDGGLDLVDIASRSVAASIPLPGTSVPGIAVSPSGNRIWAVDGTSPGNPLLLLSASAVVAGSASATATEAFTTSFGATGFDLPVTFSVTPGLPAGLTLDAATGLVSGTPTASHAATSYTVTAASADGDTASTTWSLEVAAAPPASLPPSAPATRAPAQLAASGGDIPWAAGASGLALVLAGLAVLSRRRRSSR